MGPGDSPVVGTGRGVVGEVIANVPATSMAVLSGTAPLAMFGRYAVCGLLSFTGRWNNNRLKIKTLEPRWDTDKHAPRERADSLGACPQMCFQIAVLALPFPEYAYTSCDVYARTMSMTATTQHGGHF